MTRLGGGRIAAVVAAVALAVTTVLVAVSHPATAVGQAATEQSTPTPEWPTIPRTNEKCSVGPNLSFNEKKCWYVPGGHSPVTFTVVAGGTSHDNHTNIKIANEDGLTAKRALLFGQRTSLVLRPGDTLSVVPSLSDSYELYVVSLSGGNDGPPDGLGGRPRVGSRCQSDYGNRGPRCWVVKPGQSPVAFSVVAGGDGASPHQGFVRFTINNADGLSAEHFLDYHAHKALVMRPGDTLYLSQSGYHASTLTVAAVAE